MHKTDSLRRPRLACSCPIWRRAFAAFALLVASSMLFAQGNKPKLPGEDWESLFNGKDLTGWNKVGDEIWDVEDGTIHGRAITKRYGYLQTVKKYVDFQLSLRFKCEGDGNSGVFMHTDFKPGTVDVSQGIQFEIDCRIGQHTAGIYAEDGRNWIAWPAPENETVVRSEEWNEYLIKVEGNHMITRLNGVLMVDFTDPKAKMNDGTIALQLHSGGKGNMRFKDIMIRDLTKR